jgi:ABC-type multidrug transport system fused ATPase/permease subunit
MEKPVPYTKPLVQRDNRTPLEWKQGFVGLALSVCILAMVVLGGGYYIEQESTGFESSIGENWSYVMKNWFYVWIGIFVLFIILCMYFLIQWKWAWMTVTFVPPRKTGQDVEDIDPYILQRSGHKTSMNATATTGRINAVIGDFERH